jgi:hypothetical protein
LRFTTNAILLNASTGSFSGLVPVSTSSDTVYLGWLCFGEPHDHRAAEQGDERSPIHH